MPLRLAYADPPYPGEARLYRGRPDYAGEVDHVNLVTMLQRFDGWALSTSARALPVVLAICQARGGLGVRVAAWVRGARPGRSQAPRSSWEPVLYLPARSVASDAWTVDSLYCLARPRLTDPGRCLGMKPAGFAYWLFNLLGALPGDHLSDLYPGSGGIGRAWSRYVSRGDEGRVAGDPSRLEPRRLPAPAAGEEPRP